MEGGVGRERKGESGKGDREKDVNNCAIVYALMWCTMPAVHCHPVPHSLPHVPH